MIPRTKPRGDQLSFTTECVRCRAEISINNGRVDRHDCQPNPKFAPNQRLDLEQILNDIFDNR